MKTKKFLAMLLSGLIVMSATAVSVFAEDCAEGQHSTTAEYKDGTGDETGHGLRHVITCSKDGCSYSVEEDCTYETFTPNKDNNGTHSTQCTVCKINVSYQDCEYDENNTCINCGAEKNEETGDVLIPAGTIEFTADEPVVGEKLGDMNFYIEEPFSEMANFYVEWHDQQDTVMEKCNVYTVSFGIAPINGYYFDEDSVYSYIFDGETRRCGVLTEYNPIHLFADTIRIDTHNKDANGVCTDCAKTVVSEVNIKFTSNGTGKPNIVENNGGVGYTVAYQWYVGDTYLGEEHDSNTAFESGKTYSCKITIIPDEGYTLGSLSTANISGWVGESIPMSIDGSGNGTAGVVLNSSGSGETEDPEPEVCTHNYTGKNAEVKIVISLPDGLERGSEVVISNDSDFSLTSIKKLIAREQGSTEVIDEDIELYCEIQGDNTIEFLTNNPTNWEDKPIEIMVYAKTSEDIASDSFSATMNGEELSVSNSSVKSKVTKGKNGKHKTYCVYGCGEFVEEDCSYTEGVCVCGREREENNSPINYISFEVAKPVAGEPAETYGTIDESSKSLSITAKTESGETLGTSDLKSYYAYIMEVDTEKNTGGWNVYRDNYVAGSTYALLYDIKTYNEIADDCEVYVNGVKAIAWPEELTYSGDLLVYERLTDGYGVAGLKGFYVSYPSSSGGSSSSGSSSSSSSSTTEPEKTEEKVDVKEETAKIEDAEKGEKVEVKIEGTVVPKDYIETAMVSDAIVIVSYGEYEWQISDVEEPKAVDLSIDTNAVGKIKKEIVETLEGDNTNVIDIKHNGNLGFKGTLKYNVKKENAGKYVNLYYYNIETGKLELQGSTKIDEKGFVHLPFTHCSTYVLNITSDPATSTLFEGLSAGESIKVEETVL